MNSLPLGAFSLSLAVRDLSVSKDFYSALGFIEVGGNAEHNYLIMRNEGTTIGLFAGMFEANILTFNPGWDAQGNETESFTDIRALQQMLSEHGLETGTTIDTDSGPASFMLTDPDGNTILIDQHR